MGALKASVLAGMLFCCSPAHAGKAREEKAVRLPPVVPETPGGTDRKTRRSFAGIAEDAVARWHAEIGEASARFSVPVDWIEHVMRAESAGQTVWKGVPITSKAGAMGLMQLMPGTWDMMRSALGLGSNPHDPHDNILAGTAYLRAMYERFGYPGLFAAYNAGPGRYQEHRASGRPLPVETQEYLVKVTQSGLSAMLRPSASAMERNAGHVLPARDSAKPGLFIALRGEADVGREQSDVLTPAAPSDRLFVVKGGR